MYNSYSQAVPPDTTDPADIKFYLFFMILAEQAYANEYITTIEAQASYSVLIVFGVVSFFIISVLGLIQLIAWRTSTKITKTIHTLKEITNQLKLAQTVDQKRKIIREISQSGLFKRISIDYDTMRAAKD